ncbi:actin-related protein 5 isoform X2 [Zootermopsis nevadensis]|uniref:actin-related protein 5 isoform X2 n=1 Tax=Zootermopsis nevadensis TaxID=136037 RepID=UPI000B8E61F8|nr:actin-related protein 5 isoform X2 [Zootermopsis nevadensis]
MTTLELKDAKTVPDPIRTYPKNVRNSSVPLVIDNGSYQCRVGWATQKEPLLIFKNLIAKPRKERGKKDGETQVGNDITNVEAVRFQLKTQFDRNVVTHFEAQEQVFDYMFTHLGIDTEGHISHPIVMTEAFLNPNYSRHLMSELLFECYGVPSVCYGIDGLFSFRYNNPKCSAALIINCGYHTTHILPVINNQVDLTRSRRINVGGIHIINYLHRLLQLKYPAHFAAITPSRAEELVHEQTFIAVNYQEELSLWADSDHYDDNVRRIQLPYIVQTVAPGLTPEQQKERRKELARRLIEINARKREERKILDFYELSSGSDLQKLISQLQARIERTKQKIAAANTTEDSVTEDPKPKILKQNVKPKDEEDFETWIARVRKRRQEILERRNARRQRRQDMAKRRTAAAQERMRLISQLARKEKRDDNFGMRDEDWDVYKAINKEGGDSDSDEEQKLLELEDVLRHHDPEFEGSSSSGTAGSGNCGNTAETHQLHVGIERIRAPELLFQPSMIGSGEAGLAETIEFVLRGYPADVQTALVSNVFLTGGCAAFPGFTERLHRELQEMRPFKSTFSITTAANPTLDAWYGARTFSSSPDLSQYLVTRSEYEEKGGEYLKEHNNSNKYYPSPTPLPQAETIPLAVSGEEIEIDVF